jgi:hypothetical protein
MDQVKSSVSPRTDEYVVTYRRAFVRRELETPLVRPTFAAASPLALHPRHFGRSKAQGIGNYSKPIVGIRICIVKS